MGATRILECILLHITSHAGEILGPLVGPIVAIISFVCSVGNVRLAAVLWNGGSSFGGVIAFIFADLLVIPVLNIYQKYYGLEMTGFLFATMYIAMVAAALAVEGLFGWVGLVPHEHKARIVEASIRWLVLWRVNSKLVKLKSNEQPIATLRPHKERSHALQSERPNWINLGQALNRLKESSPLRRPINTVFSDLLH